MPAKTDKLDPKDTVMDMMMKMSEGNPGALVLLTQLLDKPIGFLTIPILDSLGIYVSNMYVLWNDCCGQNIDDFIKVIRAYNCGKITKDDVWNHISGVRGTPFENIPEP